MCVCVCVCVCARARAHTVLDFIQIYEQHLKKKKDVSAPKAVRPSQPNCTGPLKSFIPLSVDNPTAASGFWR
jgi:hypothetical protein